MHYMSPGFVIHPPIRTTWNNQDKDSGITLTSGLLVATAIASGDNGVRGTIVRGSGKWYLEINCSPITGGDSGAGLANATTLFANVAASGAGAFIQFRSGNVYYNGNAQFGNTGMGGGGVLQLAYDGDAHLAWIKFAANNWNGNGSANPATAVGGLNVSAIDTVGLLPIYIAGANGDAATLNCGASSFTFSAPSGFSPWNG